MNDSNTINKGSLPGLKEKRYLQKKAIIGFFTGWESCPSLKFVA